MAAPARHRQLAAAVLAALALAGCGGASEGGIAGGGTIIGRTVTVYSLTPDPGGASADFVAGEKLALADAGGRAGALAVNFSSLELLSDDADQAAAAQRAISDPQIIAAVVNATTVTVPLFNAAGILQVAPGGDPALASDPHAQPSGRRTVGTPAAGSAPAGFADRFRADFGHAPGATAQDGYRAMRGVLQAIARAGAGGNDRTRVLDAYFGA
jgi:hypothetical protein